MIKFETGKSYSCRSVCDHDCVWTFKIARRTLKSIWVKDAFTGKIVRKKVAVWDDSETVFPLGTYSMAPILRAEQ